MWVAEEDDEEVADSGSKNAFRMLSPVFPLFSGWNWQAETFPRERAETKSAPA